MTEIINGQEYEVHELHYANGNTVKSYRPILPQEELDRRMEQFKRACVRYVTNNYEQMVKVQERVRREEEEERRRNAECIGKEMIG